MSETIIRKDMLSECCKSPVIEHPKYDNNGEEIPAHNLFCSNCYRGVYSFISVEELPKNTQLKDK